MKSAYERALEKLESEGIERPREDALSTEVKEQMASLRQKAEAKIAELEIMHKKSLAAMADPSQREAEERQFQAERRSIEERLERDIENLRRG